MYEFVKARFIKTAIWPKDYPTLKDDGGRLLPEIAVAGRSNVGKSSLLNHLFGSKGLVKTSSTPGKTQAINFFVVDEQLTFVDLPGYGYAEVPPSVRKQWGPMVEKYLKERQEIKLSELTENHLALLMMSVLRNSSIYPSTFAPLLPPGAD